jgi:hypothetical protein
MSVSKYAERKRKFEDTARERLTRASLAHLRDLRRAHPVPPPDVSLASVTVPRRLTGEPTASYCSSPAQLCAELAE